MEEEKALAAKNKANAPIVNNEFIGKIIANKGPNLDNILNPILGMGASSQEQEKQDSTALVGHQSDLKLSSFVIEMEILPKPKIETYEREI